MPAQKEMEKNGLLNQADIYYRFGVTLSELTSCLLKRQCLCTNRIAKDVLFAFLT